MCEQAVKLPHLLVWQSCGHACVEHVRRCETEPHETPPKRPCVVIARVRVDERVDNDLVRECVERHQLRVPYVKSAENLADFFTKPLAAKQFFARRGLTLKC